jgi:hypothetical protein
LRADEGRTTPAVAKSKHMLVRRHDVQNDLGRAPPAQRGSGALGLWSSTKPAARKPSANR